MCERNEEVVWNADSRVALHQIIDWLTRRRRGIKFQRLVQTAVIEAVVYMTWQARNEAFWLGKVNRIDHTVKKIQQIVKTRTRSVLPKKVSSRDKEWFESL